MATAAMRVICGIAAALAVATIGSRAAAQAVYRCDDGKGGVLYADTRCKDGTKVAMLPGKADPAAIERLRSEQRAFDERQAAREARADAEVRAQREYRLAQREWQIESGELADRYAAAAGYYWGGLWPWYPTPPLAPPLPPRPPRPQALPAPYVAATPGRLGTPSPPPGPPPRLPAPPAGKPVAAAPRG